MRQSKLGSLARVVDQAIDELFLGRVLAEVDEHGGGVAVEHRHANTLRGDLQRAVERHDLALFLIDAAEHLQRFLLGLLLFAGDERNDVAHHFRPVVERLARAGDGLIGAHDNLARLEFLPSGERRGVGLDGAVRLDGDEAVRGAEALALVLDHLIMLRVDLRHDHRHVRSPTVGAVVRHDRRFGLRVFLFDGANLSLRHVHCGEHEIDVFDHVFHVASIAARYAGAVAAINGSYFDMKAGNSVCYLRKDGVVIDTTSTGVLATVSNGAVLIKKGRLELIPWSKQEEKACTLKKGTVLASGPLMLKDGQVCDLSGTNRNFVDTKHPRSAVALTREGKILLIVVDGRRKGKAEGINIPELAHMIRVLGGEDALNLDGGGSSTLWSGELPDKGIANTPSGSAERKVANSLCVYE